MAEKIKAKSFNKNQLNIPFCVYTLFLPFMAMGLLSINGNYGISCKGSVCTQPYGEISTMITNIILYTHYFLALFGIFLYLIGGFRQQNLLNGIAVLFNLLLSVYFFERTKSDTIDIILLFGGFIFVVIYWIIWCTIFSRLIGYWEKS